MDKRKRGVIMWNDIKEILFDFLKGFRWYLLFIPFFIILFILSKFNLTFGMVTVLVALLFLLFVPFIFAFGTILSFIFNTDEREYKKHKRKKLRKK